MNAETALLVVDAQRDFMPGGALAVEGGDEIVAPLARLLLARPFAVAVATQDWHPPGHVSFASVHAGGEPFQEEELPDGRTQLLWPDHCVAGSEGAGLHEGIPDAAIDLVLRKGQARDYDSYSAFSSDVTPGGDRRPTGLAGYLRERGVRRVLVCGLARDVCVRATLEDAVRFGFEAVLLDDLTRSVQPEKAEEVSGELRRLGVELASSDGL